MAAGSLGSRWDLQYSIPIRSEALGAPSMMSKAEALTHHEAVNPGDEPRTAKTDTVWWQHGIIYQVYPRSFHDSNGDGIGDLEGIRRRLDYLRWLGVDAIWIAPIYPSPMADFGYDISDYCGVDLIFGTLGDFDRLLAEAHARGLKVSWTSSQIIHQIAIPGSWRAAPPAAVQSETGTSGVIRARMAGRRTTGQISAAAAGNMMPRRSSIIITPSSRNSPTSTGEIPPSAARCTMCCDSGWIVASTASASMCSGC